MVLDPQSVEESTPQRHVMIPSAAIYYYTISPLKRLISMQKLTVKNFLTLKDIQIDIPKINIIVGPQAEGKSLIAKLIYFFKTFVRDYRNAIAPII
jgi:SpoVK/Ycf46/Vps4 family AAA+-type ATPase